MIPAFILAIETEEERKLAEIIFDEQFSHMIKITYDILKNQHDAEDAAMNAVKSICDNINKFSDYNSPNSVSLISTYAKNAAIDIYRKNRRNAAKLQCIHENIDITDYADIPEDFVLSEENYKMIFDAIYSLEDMYRAPLIMLFSYKMKREDIGKILNIDSNTVSGRVFRGRKKLAKILNERGLNNGYTK